MRKTIILLVGIALLAQGMCCMAAADPARPAQESENSFDVIYAKVGTRELHLNLVLPKEQPVKPLPVIVWIHGGGWKGGDYTRNRAARFVSHGYAAASVQYRFSDAATFPAQIYDCKAAIRFLKANAAKYNLDANHIGVWGGSAGGHLVTLLGTSGGVEALEGSEGNPGESSRVQAVCDFFGPTKFNVDSTEPEAVRKIPEVVVQLFGGTIKEKPELYKLGSPVTFVTGDDAPFLIVHGDSDELVPVHQAEVLYDALRRAGVEATFIKVKNGDHGFSKKDQYPTNDRIEQRILEFFDKHLKG